jgi:lysophospholipase L1-like esterase
VDPLSDGWLVDGEGLVAEDDVHLTAAGQGALADLMRPVVEGTLAGTADAPPGS